jgi:hypothetical protein
LREYVFESERERERVWVSERVIEKDPEIYVVCIIMFEKLRFLLREKESVEYNMVETTIHRLCPKL